ncbi:TetR family transcriptional regulator [Nocardioides sp.]|uniref:TetR family transcriptional regulator n=1 Tax=Nocardioides sp. TaxID=35761 RepID=UPI0031FEF412|nr:transcriptional regulator, TetR family [Nocardioides sp.]
MTVSANDTRQRLIDAATRAFADHGVIGASLLEITRQAGQRNRGAVHYHFGSREGMLVAVLEQQADFLSVREGELLDRAQARPDDDLNSVIEAIVRPTVELAETGWRGRCYLVIVGDVVEQDQSKLADEVPEALRRTGGYEVYALLAERMPPMPEELRNERMALATSFILHSVADRARATEHPETSRAQLETEPFIQNLIAMVAGMVAAPLT